MKHLLHSDDDEDDDDDDDTDDVADNDQDSEPETTTETSVSLRIKSEKKTRASGEGSKKGKILSVPMSSLVKDKETGLFKCTHCPLQTKYHASIVRHLRRHSGNAQCVRCMKWFASEAEMREHFATHALQSYVCETCARRFNSANSLYKHRLSDHTDKPRFRCEECGKGFHMEAVYKDHRNSHTGAKPYVCEHCNKAYGFRASFDKHRKSCAGAVGDKPVPVYQCPHCGLILKTRVILNDHIKGRHSNTAAYTCICGRSFAWRPSYRYHKMRCALVKSEKRSEDKDE